ncbi:unnamed protein product, partial [Parascedosporium putredinis]
LVRSIFSNPNDNTKVTLVFGNVTEKDILLKHELAELENKYPQRFRAFYVLDNPQGLGWRLRLHHQGPPQDRAPRAQVRQHQDLRLWSPGLMKSISGPKVSPKDQGELTGSLKDLGYNKDQVYKF